MKERTRISKNKNKQFYYNAREYEMINVLPLSLLGKAGLNNSHEQLNNTKLLDDQRRVNFSKIKYDLTELFEKTPVFDEAPVTCIFSWLTIFVVDFYWPKPERLKDLVE